MMVQGSVALLEIAKRVKKLWMLVMVQRDFRWIFYMSLGEEKGGSN